MAFQWDSVWGYLIVAGVLLVLLQLRIALQREKWEDERLRQFLAEACESLLIALALVFFLIRPFVVHAFLIPSQSMEPSLL
ncbi:MAG: S26 family signal peptidase, partial [Armatimonadetes bacterium]|nr:S26 family signal peptidase [Armatimonadota bacterium]